MPDERLNQLLEVCSQSEAAELKILHNAQIQCLKAYQKEPTAHKKRDWDAAREGLEQCLDRLWSIYLAPGSSEALKNRIEAVAWLKEQGYKVGKSKFYDDVKAGKIKLRDDGSVPVSEIERYVRGEGLIQLSRATGQRGDDDLSEQKLKKEIEKLDWENRKREFEYERDLGNYIPKEELELELASRAGVLESGLRTKIKAHSRDWVRLVEGLPDKVPNLVEAILECLNEQLNEFARLDRFQVEFVSEEEEQ